jgi:tryptophan-rich sensory protein
MLIGVSWYAICFLGLARLLVHYDIDQTPVRLLVVLMTANALANVPLFRFGRLDWAFFYLLPYWVVLATFVLVAVPIDRLTAVLFLAYAVYQPYAAAWGWQLWALNGRFAPWLAKN